MATRRRKQPARKRRRQRMRTLDKYLIWAVLYIVGWSIAFFCAWIVFQTEPSILEGCILTPGVVELIACAWIKQGKNSADGIDTQPTEGFSDPQPAENGNTGDDDTDGRAE